MGRLVIIMSEIVRLEIPDSVARSAREVAARTQRCLEEVLVEWIGQFANEPPIDSLPDEQLLLLCDRQMGPGEQEELADLLTRNREGQLSGSQKARLDELMHIYRRGLIRKAHALKVAVERGLRLPLG
jgi:hypothetical protein